MELTLIKRESKMLNNVQFLANFINDNPGCGSAANAEEVLRNLVHACAQEPEAFELFERLVLAERVEINKGRWERAWRNLTPKGHTGLV